MRLSQRIEQFCRSLWSWNARHKRTLPWRDLQIENDTQRAYMILVSEVMLQQTQVSRVEVIFLRFLEQFPTLQDLANASNKEIIIAWRGMGYNSRALRLRDAAKTIVETHHGIFPKEMDQLLAIKGIGNYTAAAIRNFAFHLPTPCLDTNIRRIIHRVFVGPESPEGIFETPDRELMPYAGNALDIAVGTSAAADVPTTGTDGADWHAALMDFGSAVCTKRSPKCDICPMAKNGICKSAFRIPIAVETPHGASLRESKREPGRMVGSTFIPNRIFRGRIIEELRNESNGLLFEEIGRRIAIDWNGSEHAEWLQSLLDQLQKETFIHKSKNRFMLAS